MSKETTSEKLEPCPFCGDKAHLIPSGSEREEMYSDPAVRCGNPACECRISAATSTTAIRRWNTRPRPADGMRAALVDRLVEEAMSVCEPENADKKASDHTRGVLTKRFTAALRAPADEVIIATVNPGTEKEQSIIPEHPCQHARQTAAIGALSASEGPRIATPDEGWVRVTEDNKKE